MHDMADDVLARVTTSAMSGDLDDAGRSLVLLADRVELRDPKGNPVAALRLRDVNAVEVQRRFAAATVSVRSHDGAVLEIKGIKSSKAARFKELMAAQQLGEVTVEPSSPTAKALLRLEELAAMGVLSPAELASKRTQVIRHGVIRT